jgi:hypothetical protein
LGEHEIQRGLDPRRLRTFVRALLDDVQALERLCAEGRVESGVRRIGSEQEMFLVDAAQRPAPVAAQMLERLDDPAFTVELGRFNLEANLDPQVLGGDCLSRLERELDEKLARARGAARELSCDVVLTGILPTLEQRHLGLDMMTPSPRFHQLNEVMREFRGMEFHTYIKGVDELSTRHDNVMLEACNTSFQVHFQVGPDEFARLYNLAQAVTGPLLAAAVNSPLLLRHRLWMETRVALFQQSLDSRSQAHQNRGVRQRVTFGDTWVKDSVLDLYREDVARHRVVIASDPGESSFAQLERGEVPSLKALCLHNGTVYRWNRPCYGVKDGVAHLRIENRVIPAGPTVLDEIANAAFFFGLMMGVDEKVGDVSKAMEFDEAKSNFMAAARYGLDAQLTWLGGQPCSARELILRELLPDARAGLVRAGLDPGDVQRYLDVIEERVESGRTGARWTLDSLAELTEGGAGAGRRDGARLRHRSAGARVATGRALRLGRLARELPHGGAVHDHRPVHRPPRGPRRPGRERDGVATPSTRTGRGSRGSARRARLAPPAAAHGRSRRSRPGEHGRARHHATGSGHGLPRRQRPRGDARHA